MGKPYVAFLWHHHQPPYRDPRRADAPLVLPWVRLHAARDYYQMGHLAGSVAGLRVTFNFTPVLLAQFDDYAVGGRRDRLQELSLREPQRLAAAERDELIAACFDVDFRHAVRNHRRYYKLFRKYARREGFTAAELTDAVALFNLAWVGEIFRAGPFTLETGAVVDVAPLWEKGGGYSRADVEAVVAAQLDIMRAVVPLHRRLWEEGKVELATTPFYHPILPLLHDTDDAIIDRPGSVHPPRFAYGADARTQLERGLALFEEKFGRRPRGMWPAEGAVGEAVLPYFTAAGITWLATDEGVLARSGAAGYDVSRPEVLFRPYRVGPDGLAVFFRHRGLSDAIGFVYQHWQDPEHAARDFVKQLGALCAAARRRSVRDCVVTVILDGENAWGAYPRHGVPFLSALYRALAAGDAAQPVTFAEYLAGNPGRDLAPHPPATLDPLDGLACASWIDEVGSLPGNDLGGWESRRRTPPGLCWGRPARLGKRRRRIRGGSKPRSNTSSPRRAAIGFGGTATTRAAAPTKTSTSSFAGT
jgi:alpha-amylase/alpha-mannosidase (GH57 family)